jgi:GAF domain-containing protein
MMERISAWLAPTADDPDVARRQYLLNIVLFGLAGPGFLFGVISTVLWVLGTPSAIGALAGFGVQPFYLLAYWLGRRGRVRLAAFFPVVGVFLAMIGGSYQIGVGHATLIGYAMVTLTASLLIGNGAALFFVLLGTVAHLSVGMAQAAGRLPGVISPASTVVADAAGIGLGLVVLVIFEWFNSREMGQALQRERKLSAELETHRLELEHRVAERTADLERRSMQLEAAAQVGRRAAAIQDVDRLMDETVHFISDRFGFYHAGIFLVDETGEYAVLRAASSEGGQQMIARGRKLRVGQIGFVGSVAGTGQPRVALNVASRIEAPPDSIFSKRGFAQGSSSHQAISAEDTASFSVPELPLTRSEMALPLKAHDRVIGVLDIHSTQAAAFSEEDQAVLQILADQVALAIENARLLEEAEKRFHEVDVLLGHHSQEGWQRLATDKPRWGYTYDGTATVPHDTGYEIKTELDPQLTVPLQIRGLTIGDLNLDLANQPLTPDAEALAQAVAEQASQALENARLFQAAQRSLRETETLYLASQAIGAADSVEQVGQALIDYAATSGVDAARFLLFEHDAISGNGGGKPTHIVMQEGWTVDDRPAQPYGTRLPMGDYPLADLLDPNTPIIVQDILTDPRANEAARTFITEISGLRALIMTPIATGGRWIGMLSAGLNEPFKFPEELVRGYETLSGQAAVALEGIRLLEETRQRAERERLTSEITSRMRETLDIDTVLQTAIREMGQALNIAQVEVRMASGHTIKD